jgi:hypothetical protein
LLTLLFCASSRADIVSYVVALVVAVPFIIILLMFDGKKHSGFLLENAFVEIFG